MPQMAPINWLTLYVIFFITFIMFNIMNYYNYISQPNLLLKKNYNYYHMNWKW